MDDGFREGKPRLDFKISEVRRAHGLTDSRFAELLRAAYFGAEVQRVQQGRNFG